MQYNISIAACIHSPLYILVLTLYEAHHDRIRNCATVDAASFFFTYKTFMGLVVVMNDYEYLNFLEDKVEFSAPF